MIVSNKAIERISQILHGREGKTRPEPTKAPAASQSDAVTISSQGREMQALQRRLAELPEVRTERVAALREAIERGEYRVSAEAIAERILQQEKGR